MSSAMSGLLGALGGGGAPPPPDPTADQSGGPDDTTENSQYTDSMSALDGAEEALHAFIQLDPDEGDRAVAAQCLQNVIKLKAKNQQVQGGGDMTGLARALQSSGAGGPPGSQG